MFGEGFLLFYFLPRKSEVSLEARRRCLLALSSCPWKGVSEQAGGQVTLAVSLRHGSLGSLRKGGRVPECNSPH